MNSTNILDPHRKKIYCAKNNNTTSNYDKYIKMSFNNVNNRTFFFTALNIS